MKRILKRTLAVFLAVVMVFGIAHLNGFVGLELPKINGFEKISKSVSEFLASFAMNAQAATSDTCGENLQCVSYISDKKANKSLKNIKIRIACDVVNPLFSKNGATYIYGRQKGAEVVLNCADYENKLKTANLVITGEGRIDNQTVFGKLPQIVAKKANEADIECIALVGSSVADSESLNGMGIKRGYQLVDYAPFDECMNNTRSVAEKVLNKIKDDIKQ